VPSHSRDRFSGVLQLELHHPRLANVI